MARFPRGRWSGAHPLLALGTWLHPVSTHRRRSVAERSLQQRAGVLGLVCISTGAAGVGIALEQVLTGDTSTGLADPAFGSATLQGAVILVAISVFAPQAIFRTRNAALTREVLSNPSAPIRPWRSTTITFDAVLVGALLAGLYFDAALALAFFGLAFIARIIFQGRRELALDPNARFHSLTTAWAAAITGAAAYAVVRPIAESVSVGGSIVPLLLAALVAMYVGLGINALERWVNGDRTRWAFARDAVDTRRIIVALVSALIAWLVSVVGTWVAETSNTPGPEVAASLAGLGVFLASWLILWYASIRLWYRDAQRTLGMWSEHQSEIVNRLADGSLSPDLAARASLPVTSRMAVSVFAATRVMTVLDEGPGQVRTVLVAVDRFDQGAPPDPRSLVDLPHLRMPLFAVPGHANTSSVTVAGWLWPGWFMTRSKRLVRRFRELASTTMLTPALAAHDDSRAGAFDSMFDPLTRWPTFTAFEEAVERMRARVDASPQSDSLVVGVFAIDEFGALAGGRFEQAAVAQVMRLATGYREFSGHDVFIAYEDPGRVWVALAGGPLIRSGISLLRGLQEQINDHGAVQSSRMDIEIHVSVSFGYAAHQVDDFTFTGLVDTARGRLAADQGVRDPFSVDRMLTHDISPEDIIGPAPLPVTAVDVLDLLRSDRLGGVGAAFPAQYRPMVDLDDDSIYALLLSLGWARAFGTMDLTAPEAFHALVNRQAELAAEASRASAEIVRGSLADLDAAGRTDLAVVVWMPSILLGPEAGELALPNVLLPGLSRAQCARTVILLDSVPPGAGQALRLIADRGVHIAVSAAVAASADGPDLAGWQRWAVLFPQHVAQGPGGVDGLLIQQTASAIAGRDTRLVAVADDRVDTRALAANNVRWTVDPGEGFPAVAEAVSGTVRR